MSETVIRVDNLGKQYRIGETLKHDTFRDLASDLFSRHILRRKSQPKKGIETIWALKNVSFEVKRGEVVGIIGRNGAGKSTLLKILSRITDPTEGRAEICGRVGSLLEVGTGFHPELTGRENIYLNGAILGMTKNDIHKQFDAIVEFAEIEKFLDTPVKRYSSGMYVRLAFAVAAHLEPEVLVVDEVLAVGDAAFQKKCLRKMGDVAQEGRTILFVSHNMGAITRLCKRAIWVDAGKIVFDGLSDAAVAQYQSKFLNACSEWTRPPQQAIHSEISFTRVAVMKRDGSVAKLFNGDEDIVVEIDYEVRCSLSGCQIGMRLYNAEGQVVFSSADSDAAGVSALPKDAGTYKGVFVVPGRFLAPGTYYVLVAAHLPQRNVYDMIDQTVVFEVSSSGSLVALDGRIGVVTPLIRWETNKL